MAGTDEQLVRFVDHASGADRPGQTQLRGDGVEGGVDRPGFDGADRRVDVGIEGDDVQLDVRMRVVEVLDERCRDDPPGDDVDAQCASARAYRGVGALGHLEQFTGVGQKCLAVDGELGAACRAGEQAHVQVLLQCRDALGDRLLSDRQLGGCLLELAGVRGGDEGPHGVEVHAANPIRTTRGCGSPPARLFDRSSRNLL